MTSEEAFKQYCELDPYGKLKRNERVASFIDFKAGFDFNKSIIDELLETIERIKETEEHIDGSAVILLDCVRVLEKYKKGDGDGRK